MLKLIFFFKFYSVEVFNFELYQLIIDSIKKHNNNNTAALVY